MAKPKTEFVMIGVLPETRDKARQLSELLNTTIYEMIGKLVDRAFDLQYGDQRVLITTAGREALANARDAENEKAPAEESASA
jgi:hypothetical protein